MKKPAPTLPRKLWIGTYEFKLNFTESEHPGLCGEDGQMEADGRNCIIWLAEDMGPRRLLEIVLHEITHAINWVHDIDDDDGKTVIKEEALAQKHGMAWSQFWLDNPRFERWFVFALARIRRERRVDDPPTTESK